MSISRASASRGALWLGLAAGLGALLAHRSQSDSLLGRYSATQILLTVAYVVVASRLVTVTGAEPDAPRRRVLLEALGVGLALWLPLLVLDLFAPAGIREIGANPALAKQFAASLAVLCGILAWLGLLAWAAMRCRRRGAPPAAVRDGLPGSVGPALALVASALLIFGAAGVPGLTVQAAIARLPAPLLATVLLASVGAIASLLLALRAAGDRPAAAVFTALGAAALTLWTASALNGTVGQAGPRRAAVACGVLAAAVLLAWRRTHAHTRRLVGGAVRVAAFGISVVPPLWLALGSRAATHTVRRDASRRAPAPHVVLFVVDTLRADHLNAYGYHRPTSPFLEQLTRDESGRALVFDNAWAGATATIPSVKALFTSRPASAWGLEQAGLNAPPAGVMTMARAFQDAGYATGGFTANHLVSGPGFEQGFEEYQVFEGQTALERSFLLRRLVAGGDWWRLFHLANRLRLCKAPGAAVWSAASRWLAAERDRPMFAYVHLLEPHFPYASHAFGLGSAGQAGPALSDEDVLRLRPGDPANHWLRNAAPLREIVGRYDEEVRAVDEILKGAVGDLKELGLWDSTLFVFLADHGEEFCEHDGFMHGHDVFPEQSRVPLVVFWPRDTARPEMTGRVTAHASLLDVFPTLVEHLGLRAEGRSAAGGQSLLPWIRRRDARRGVIVESFPTVGSCISGVAFGSRLARVGFTRHVSPQATLNASVHALAMREGAPFGSDDDSALIDQARAVLHERWLTATTTAAPWGSALGGIPSGEATDEVIERLRALGYVH